MLIRDKKLPNKVIGVRQKTKAQRIFLKGNGLFSIYQLITN